jgi:hypothetical protein
MRQTGRNVMENLLVTKHRNSPSAGDESSPMSSRQKLDLLAGQSRGGAAPPGGQRRELGPCVPGGGAQDPDGT